MVLVAVGRCIADEKHAAWCSRLDCIVWADTLTEQGNYAPRTKQWNYAPRTKQWNYEPGTKQQQRVHQFPAGADCMQKNTWFDRCHSAKLRLRSLIHSSRFMSLSSSDKDAFWHQSVFVFVCVYCMCYICMFNPTTWAHICVCVGHREGLLQVRNSHPVDSIWLTACYFNRWNLHSCGFWWRSDDETQKVNIASSKIVQCWGVKT